MRDLPELDSVTCGGPAMHAVNVIGWVVIAVILGTVCAGVVEGVARLITGRWLAIPICIGVAIGFAALIAAWMSRRDWFDWQWTTDAQGLTVRGVFRKRHIAWSEITEARGDAKSSGKVYRLKTNSAKLSITDVHGAAGQLIGASIYQHLRRFGKADESLLTAGARTFWVPIPKEVPEEMDWHHPKPPNWSIAAAVMIVIAIAAPIAYYLGPKIKLGEWWNTLSHSGWALVLHAYKLLRERLIMASSVAIRNDHIEMRTPRGLVFLPWTDIKYVHWDNSRRTLSLGRATFTDVAVIPYRADWPDSAACILAIIRHLRDVHHTPPVIIPPQLLSVMYSGEIAPVSAFGEGQVVEVRIAHGPGYALLSMLCVAPFLGIWWLTRDPSRLVHVPGWIFALPMAFVAVAVVGMFFARTTYRADSQGLTVISPGRRRRFIDWRDVASYVVTSGSGRKAGRVLTDSLGGVILRIPFAERANPNAEAFIAYLDARLAPVRLHNLPTMTR